MFMKNTFKAGFTIKELLITMGIMGVLMAVILPNIQDARRANRDRVRVAHMEQLRLTLEDYKLRCREYPATLELGENNGCPSGVSLASFISAIPDNPNFSGLSNLNTGFIGATTENGFYYAGLSNSSSGRCYDYHIGIELENESSTYLSKDHDISPNNGTYTSHCSGSQQDFGQPSASADDAKGFYDFNSNLTE